MATVTVSVPKVTSSGARGRVAGQLDPDALPHSLYLPTWRPWLALYGARVRPAGARRAQEVRSQGKIVFIYCVHVACAKQHSVDIIQPTSTCSTVLRFAAPRS